MGLKRAESFLSFGDIPKRDLDQILRYLVLLEIQQRKNSGGPALQHRSKHLLFQYYKNFRLVSRLKGAALCLLKTQFAKKPKNPV